MNAIENTAATDSVHGNDRTTNKNLEFNGHSAREDLSESEERIRDLVFTHLKGQNQWNIEKNLAELLDTESGFVGRFDFFMPLIPERCRESILISGCSAGSELIVAQRYGFRRIFGTEISQELVDICNIRVPDRRVFRVSLIESEKLPYLDEEFSVVYSGHIIEHTPRPDRYFAEHFRVLKPRGYFFLEFPNRYHHTELHTGLPSWEWAPRPLRSIALRVLSSPFSPYEREIREKFDLVRRTLQPISVSLIKGYMRRYGTRQSRVVAIETPAPGFMRILLQK